jgi:hypothetical protein
LLAFGRCRRCCFVAARKGAPAPFFQNEINPEKKQAESDEFLVTDYWKGDLDRVSLVGGIEPLGQLAQQSFGFLGVCTKKVLEVVPGHGVEIEIRDGNHRGRARQS